MHGTLLSSRTRSLRCSLRFHRACTCLLHSQQHLCGPPASPAAQALRQPHPGNAIRRPRPSDSSSGAPQSGSRCASGRRGPAWAGGAAGPCFAATARRQLARASLAQHPAPPALLWPQSAAVAAPPRSSAPYGEPLPQAQAGGARRAAARRRGAGPGHSGAAAAAAAHPLPRGGLPRGADAGLPQKGGLLAPWGKGRASFPAAPASTAGVRFCPSPAVPERSFCFSLLCIALAAHHCKCLTLWCSCMPALPAPSCLLPPALRLLRPQNLSPCCPDVACPALHHTQPLWVCYAFPQLTTTHVAPALCAVSHMPLSQHARPAVHRWQDVPLVPAGKRCQKQSQPGSGLCCTCMPRCVGPVRLAPPLHCVQSPKPKPDLHTVRRSCPGCPDGGSQSTPILVPFTHCLVLPHFT